MKAQMKLADRSGARLALIVGPGERAAGTVTVRPLRGDGEQRTVPLAEAAAAVEAAAGAPPAAGAQAHEAAVAAEGEGGR
jgi:histidyl-tRNA synthetase